MNVFEIIPGCEDIDMNFAGQPDGICKIALWASGGWKRTSHQTPAVGDLVAVRRDGNKVAVYRINSIQYSFTGSDGNQLWTGMMQDVIKYNLFTPEMRSVLDARLR